MSEPLMPSGQPDSLHPPDILHHRHVDIRSNKNDTKMKNLDVSAKPSVSRPKEVFVSVANSSGVD